MDSGSELLDDASWSEAEVVYKAGKQPLLVDVSRASSGDELLSDEVEEFVEFLEDVDDSPGKQKVLAHLADSRAVVGLQLLGDVDDDGYNAAGTFLCFFVEHCGAMIQGDGEGFYEGDRVILELE